MRLGIDFGGTNVKFGLFEEDGRTYKFEVKKASALGKEKTLFFKLLNAAEQFVGGKTLSCGGISIKGLVDRKTGLLIEDIGLAHEFAGMNLREMFSSGFNVPFTIDNDARSYAFGEWKHGAGRRFDSVIVMTLGTGVGCAAVIDGKLFAPENPAGGILGGHISIDRHGPDCPCGNKGCLELYCSASAFEKEVVNKFPELKESDNPLKTFFGLTQCEPEYNKLLREFQENLAVGIVNVIHAYGINNIILGGGMMKSCSVIIPGLKEIVVKRAWTYPKGEVEILPAELEDKAACIGAAFMNI